MHKNDITGYLLKLLLLLVTNMLINFASAWALPSEISGVLGLTRSAREIYAITGEPGGLYRSVDGMAWVRSLPLANTHSYFSALSVAKSGMVYGASTDGLLHSNDGGRIWYTTPSDEQIFFVLPVADNTLLARTWQKGLLRSGDDGSNWYPVGAEFGDNPVLALLQDNHGAVWAATFGGGIYRSTDHGVTWTAYGLAQSYVITLVMAGDGTIYAGTYQDGIYRYGPGGWISVNQGLPEPATVRLIAVTPAGLVASIEHYGLYSSITGKNWLPVAGAPTGIAEITGVLPLKDNHWLVATHPQGLFHVNPVTHFWRPISMHANIQTVTPDHCGGAYILLADGKIFHSANCGVDGAWEAVASIPADSTQLYISHSGMMLAGGKSGLFIQRTPQARESNWQQVVMPYPDLEITCITGTEFNLIVGSRRHGLFRATNDGRTWIPLPEGNAINSCVAIGNYLYAATATGLAVSHDGGILWTRYPLAPAPVVLTPDGEHGVIMGQNGTSTHAKAQFMASNPSSSPSYLYLDGGMLTTIRALTIADDILYAAATNGLELFQREGTFWHGQGKILPHVTINQLLSLPNGRVLVASNKGLFMVKGLDEAIPIPIASGTNDE